MNCPGCGHNITIPVGPIGPPGPGGSFTIFNITYSQIAGLISGSGLTPGAIYFVTDRNIYLTALTVNGFSSEAVYKATNADYNNVTGNFIGVWTGTTTVAYNTLVGSFQNGETVTGGTSGATGVIVIDFSNNGNSFRGMNIISKNGAAFLVGETLTGGTSAATAVTVTVTTTAILGTIAINKIVAWNNLHYKNITGAGTIRHPSQDATNWLLLAITDVSYQIEYDEIIYNITTDTIVSRRDKRGNIVVDKTTAPNSITKFQWGRDAVYGNEIFSQGFEGWNAATGQNNIFCQDSGCYIVDTANITYSFIDGRSSVIVSGASDALASMIWHGNLTMTAGVARQIFIKDFGDLTVISSAASGSDSDYTNCNIILTGTSVLSACEIDGGATVLTKTFNNESFTNKVYKRDVESTFNIALSQAFGLTTLTLSTSDIYGIYNVTITGGNALIDTIANMPLVMPIEINSVGTNTLTFVHLGAGSLYLKGGVNAVLNPANKDWIMFQIITAVIQEINSSIDVGSIIPVLNTVFVSKSGNDTTGVTGRFDKPFLTITAAQAVATSGQTVFVYPGTYTDFNLGKAGVNYHFVNGAIIACTTNNMWIDTAGISYSVTGDGQFDVTSGRVINFTAGGTLTIDAKKFSNTTANLCTASNSSKVYANVSVSVISTSGNCFVTGGAGAPLIDITAKFIDAGTGAIAGLSPTGGFVYITADDMKSSGANLFFLTGTVVIRGQMNYTGTGIAIAWQSLVTNTNIYGILINNSSAKAIQDNGASGTINFYNAIIGTGYVDLTGTTATHTYYDEISTNVTTQSSIVMTTGTVRCKSRITNADANAASYGITKTTGTLILEDTIIKTNGGTESIHSAAPQNIKVLGTLISNVAVSVNITDIAGGTFQTDADVV